jgi:hypothetical protein
MSLLVDKPANSSKYMLGKEISLIEHAEREPLNISQTLIII